jgi:hypothetical protein
MSKKERTTERPAFCGLTVNGKDSIFPAIKFVASAVSKDPTRSHMMGFHIEADPETGRVRFIATDGSRMHIADIAPGQVNVWKAEGIDLANFSGETYEVKASASLISLGRKIDGKFPDFRKVIPETDEASAHQIEFEEKDGGYFGLIPFFESAERFNMKYLEPIQKIKSVKWAAYFNNLPGNAAVIDGTPQFLNCTLRAVIMPMVWVDYGDTAAQNAHYLAHGFKEFFRATGVSDKVDIIIARRCPEGYDETEEAALVPEKVAYAKAEAEAKKKAKAEAYEVYRREVMERAEADTEAEVMERAEADTEAEATERADIVDYIAGALGEMEDDLPDDIDIDDTAFEIARAAEKAEADEQDGGISETKEAPSQTYGLDKEPDVPSNPQTIKWVVPFCGHFVEVTGDPTPPPRNKPHCEQAAQPTDEEASAPVDESDRAQLAAQQAPALAGFIAGVF